MGETPDTISFLERAKAGDAEAFGQLCSVFETGLLRHAMTLCGNASVAQDLAQDTLVEAWKSLRRYNGRCRLFTWLCAILLNRYRNTTRQKRPISFSALNGDDEENAAASFDCLPDSSLLPSEAVQLREQTALILECIAALPKKHQEVIYLRFYVDQSLEGIAAALSCSVGTVKSRLFRALDHLRAMNQLRERHELPKASKV